MPLHTRSLTQTTRCFGCSASAGLLAEGALKLLGDEWVFSRRRDARLEGSLEISRRFSPNVFKWYGATLVIAANYTGSVTRWPTPMIQNDSGLSQGPTGPSVLG